MSATERTGRMAHDAAWNRCPWCQDEYPDFDGPTHRYLESSRGCWSAYGQVLAREYSDSAYYTNHRLTVDAYAAQHPGEPSPQTVRSVGVHLLSLYLVLELDVDQQIVMRLIQKASVLGGTFRWLEPPDDLGSITVKDVLAAGSAHEHANMVEVWAQAVWAAWHEHHASVGAWSTLVL